MKNIKKICVLSVMILFLGLNVTARINQKIENKKFYAEQYIVHTVEKGESIWGIANKYKGYKRIDNMMAEIRILNNLNEVIHPGQALIVPVVKGE